MTVECVRPLLMSPLLHESVYEQEYKNERILKNISTNQEMGPQVLSLTTRKKLSTWPWLQRDLLLTLASKQPGLVLCVLAILSTL